MNSLPELQRTLAERFIDSQADSKILGWGQYLQVGQPNPSTQTGIFGTAAALELLCAVDPNNYAQQIESALATLPLLGTGSEIPSLDARAGTASSLRRHYEDKGDLKVTHKLAALLDAANALSRTTQYEASIERGRRSALETLLSSRIPEGAWRDHPLAPDTSLHATAVALFSLSLGPATQAVTSALQEARTRFRGVGFEEVAVSTNAILLIALQNFRCNPAYTQALSNWGDLETRAERSLLSWIDGSSARGVLRSLEAIEYALPQESEANNAPADGLWSFMLYLPHIVVSQAILRCDRLRSNTLSRQFALVVIQFVANRIKTKNCFVTEGRKQVSTVEQMWIFRLFVTLETEGSNLYTRFPRVARFRDDWRLAERRRWRDFAQLGAGLSLLVLFIALLSIGGARSHGGVAIGLFTAAGALAAAAVTALIPMLWRGRR